MSKAEQDAALERFVAGLKADSFDDYRIVPIVENYDSDWHMAAWDGRFLVLSGRVELEIGGRKFCHAAGESYEVPANTRHREVFPDGGSLVIARRNTGAPLPPLREPSSAVLLR